MFNLKKDQNQKKALKCLERKLIRGFNKLNFPSKDQFLIDQLIYFNFKTQS